MTESSAVDVDDHDEQLGSLAARPHPELLDLGRYPFRFEARVRFSDLDLLAHVNNLAIGGFHEEGRAALSQLLFATAGPQDMPRVMAVQTTTHFLAQAFWPGALTVGTGIGRIGRTSYVASSAVFRADVCVSVSSTVLVLVGDDGPVPLGAAMREKLAAYRMTGPGPG